MLTRICNPTTIICVFFAFAVIRFISYLVTLKAIYNGHLEGICWDILAFGLGVMTKLTDDKYTKWSIKLVGAMVSGTIWGYVGLAICVGTNYIRWFGIIRYLLRYHYHILLSSDFDQLTSYSNSVDSTITHDTIDKTVKSINHLATYFKSWSLCITGCVLVGGFVATGVLLKVHVLTAFSCLILLCKMGIFGWDIYALNQDFEFVNQVNQVANKFNLSVKCYRVSQLAYRVGSRCLSS